MVQRAQKPNILQPIVCRHRSFIGIHKQTRCRGNDKIAVGGALFKNTSVKGCDICVCIKMIPGEIGKIDDVTIS